MKRNKINKIIAMASMCAVSLLMASSFNTAIIAKANTVPSISYCSHVQNIGWQNYKNSNEMSGTEGKSLRLEGIKIKINGNEDLGIKYSTHVQNIGWQYYVEDNQMAGTTGKSLRLEAIKIELTGTDADKYDIYYSVHVQNIGWQDWKKNGEIAGTTGKSLRLEGIKIRICKKNTGNDANSTVNNDSDVARFNQIKDYISISELGEIDYNDTFTCSKFDNTQFVYCRNLSEKVFDKINEYRASKGYTKLRKSDELGKEAKILAIKESNDEPFSHKSGLVGASYIEYYCSDLELKANISDDYIAKKIIQLLYGNNIEKYKVEDKKGSVKIYLGEVEYKGSMFYSLQVNIETEEEHLLPEYETESIKVNKGDNLN